MDEDDQEADTRSPGWMIVAKFFIIPQRIFLAIMGWLAIVNAYTMRNCMPATITQFVQQYNHTAPHICPVADAIVVDDVSGDRYDWSQELQGYIVSSYYIGYMVTHLPGGLLAARYGGKWVLGLGILSTAVLTIFTPLCIYYGGAYALIVLRVLMGLGEGPTFPALATLLSQWVPARERGILGALVLGGGQIGSIMGNIGAGYILHYSSWPWVFYIFSLPAALWVVFFLVLCSNDPMSHPFIKSKEKEYLLKEMGHMRRRHDLPPTPWMEIATSVPMLVLMFCQLGHDWCFYLLTADLSKYFNDVLQFSVKQNGIFSSLPYLLMWIISIISGWITDRTIIEGLIDITAARKINTAIAAIGPAIFLLAASYAECSRVLVVVFFTICMGLMGTFYAGMKLTPLDISPNYAGTLMAINNGFSAFMGFVVPVVVGLIIPNSTMIEWRTAFWLTFILMLVTVTPFCLWASAEIQPWNDPLSETISEEEAEARKRDREIDAAVNPF